MKKIVEAAKKGGKDVIIGYYRAKNNRLSLLPERDYFITFFSQDDKKIEEIKIKGKNIGLISLDPVCLKIENKQLAIFLSPNDNKTGSFVAGLLDLNGVISNKS